MVPYFLNTKDNTVASYLKVYLGKDGLSLNMPFIKLCTSGYFPKVMPCCGSSISDNADRAASTFE